jgi:ABC-2 type transport system ATP-binding protein
MSPDLARPPGVPEPWRLDGRVAEYGDGLPADLAIETDALTRRFGAQVAVDGIDLRVPRCSFYGFLGENGAGKSTTISMLTGVLAPTSGAMRVLGLGAAGGAGFAGVASRGGRQSVASIDELKRRIGVVPDGLLLFDRLTGREHLIFVARLFGLDRSEAAGRADELLEAMELAQDARKLVADYSFGMRKKLALAAALIHGPELLFLDEPFEGVDAVAKASLTALLADLVTRRRLTVFLTSHVLEVVERLCDQVGIIHRGRLVAQGSLAGVLQAAGAPTLTDAFVKLVGEGRGGSRTLSFLP